MNKQCVRLFWTGGWDSTFRLLQLIFEYKVQVEPVYIIDYSRKSLGMEIRTIRRIKDTLFQNYPFSRKLIQSIVYLDAYDISIDMDLQHIYNRIMVQRRIGIQYLWLANICKQNKLKSVEVCIQQHQNHKRKDFCLASRIKNDDLSLDEVELYRYFTFPLINHSKSTMLQIVKKNNWESIMGMTWFCHNPYKGNKPCGACTPCRIAIEEGFSWRIPVYRQIRGNIINYFSLQYMFLSRQIRK